MTGATGRETGHTAPEEGARVSTRHRNFPQTHWSVVLEASGESNPERARRAFEQLCAEYRDAIVNWMRLQHLPPEDAEDAAHDFLEQWLKRENPLQGYERGERRFREFLGVCLRRFLEDWRTRRAAKRRGGGAPHDSLEMHELAGNAQIPSWDIDYALAREIHERTLGRLKTDWQAKLAGDAFDRVMGIASGSLDSPGYSGLAAELGVPIGTVKSWVFRLRCDYHDGFRDAVLRLVDPALVEDDLVYLHGLLLTPPGRAH